MKQVYQLIDGLVLPFPTDKILHFVGCLAIAIGVGLIAYYLRAEYPQGYGVVAGVLAAIAKEGLDEYKFRKGEHPEGANFFDFFSSLGGTFFGGLVVTLL